MSVIDVKIESRKPYADGRQFGERGAFEQVDGAVTFAVDPGHPANAGIVDLELAPRDAQGRVRFRSDFSLVRPIDHTRGNGCLLVELVNRGRKLSVLNRAAPLEGAVPGSDPGDGFLFRRGWTVASIGWQWDVIRDAGLLGFDAPPVLSDGLPATGTNIVTIRPNKLERSVLLANRVHQAYPAVRIDDTKARLFVRDYEEGADTLIPRDDWRFAREAEAGSISPSREHVFLKTGFVPGKTYNLIYEAEGAKVVGAGLLAFRDIGAYLRRPGAVDAAPPGFDRLYGFGVSQTGRFLRHYLYLGLNLDEEGHQVYDGLLVDIAGGRRGEFNHRFAQPSVSMTPGFGNTFPFADDEGSDPFSGRTDGLLHRQRERGGVPKLLYTNTSAEYWRGDAAMTHVDVSGKVDLEGAPESRIYHFAGTQHSPGSLPQRDVNPNEGTRGRYAFNVVDYSPLLRAALVNLDLWVREGVEPPPSKHPRLRDGTLTDQASVFETLGRLPEVVPPDPSHLWGLRELELGPEAGKGIGSYPAKLGRPYPRLVPAVDEDGNDLGGIRLPDLTVPVGTHTGWNPRHPDTGSPDQIISMMGMTRFFPATRDDRLASGDPRASVEERYGSRDEYISRVREEAAKLVALRYLLDEDVEIVVANAAQRFDAAMVAAKTTANVSLG